MVSFQPNDSEFRSIMDDVLAEDGLKTDPRLADRRHYPAIDKVESKERGEQQVNQLFIRHIRR